MKAQELEEIFIRLKSSSENNIEAKSVKFEDLIYLILLYKDSEGLPVILIESREGFLNFTEIKGITILNKSYSLEGIKTSNFYEYSCSHQQYQPIFFPFISDVLSRLSQGLNLLKAHKTSLKLWKHCFEDPDSLIMSVEKEIGLIGELWILSRLLNINEHAIEWWKGPSGGPDFQIPGMIIEVKSTLKSFHSHTVNGLEQLMDRTDKSLYLCSIIFEPTEGDTSNSVSLCHIYHEILEFINNDVIKTDIFHSKIKQLQISKEIIEMHDFRKYFIHEAKAYKVINDFPRLTPDSLKNPLSSRISKIRYDIDLDGLEAEQIDKFIENLA